MKFEYKKYKEQTITDFSDEHIESMYDQGFVFTRLGRGVMHQIDSVRVDLEQFEMSSENRRIFKKSEGLEMSFKTLDSFAYDWQIGKQAKDFYDTKFGAGIMSANKVREMFTDADKSNMNCAFVYVRPNHSNILENVGMCLAVETQHLVHYSYPFYDLDIDMPNAGMTMMLRAVVWAQEQSKKHIYLGSDKRYKHQFKGLKVFNPEDGWNIR